MPRCSEVRQRESRLRRAACRKASTAQFRPTPASRGIVGRFRAVELLSSGRPTLDLFCSKAVQRRSFIIAGRLQPFSPLEGVMVRIRKLVLALVSLLTLALVGVPGAAQAEKRIALVIGNAGYQAGALNTPANDAGLIAQTLQAAGF